jgi:hypothetical protein
MTDQFRPERAPTDEQEGRDAALYASSPGAIAAFCAWVADRRRRGAEVDTDEAIREALERGWLARLPHDEGTPSAA